MKQVTEGWLGYVAEVERLTKDLEAYKSRDKTMEVERVKLFAELTKMQTKLKEVTQLRAHSLVDLATERSAIAKELREFCDRNDFAYKDGSDWREMLSTVLLCFDGTIEGTDETRRELDFVKSCKVEAIQQRDELRAEREKLAEVLNAFAERHGMVCDRKSLATCWGGIMDAYESLAKERDALQAAECNFSRQWCRDRQILYSNEDDTATLTRRICAYHDQIHSELETIQEERDGLRAEVEFLRPVKFAAEKEMGVLRAKVSALEEVLQERLKALTGAMNTVETLMAALATANQRLEGNIALPRMESAVLSSGEHFQDSSEYFLGQIHGIVRSHRRTTGEGTLKQKVIIKDADKAVEAIALVFHRAAKRNEELHKREFRIAHVKGAHAKE